MSASRDQIGIPNLGVQSIAPTTVTLWPVASRKPKDDSKDDHNTDDRRSKSADASPSRPPPGTGNLVDKAV
jgi:hypothetical protein